MAKVTNRVTINRPIEDVFAVMTDVENTGTWFPGNVEERWTSEAPHGVGSTRHAVVVMLGRRSENDAVTTEYDPPHRAAMRGTTPNAPFVVTMTFSSGGGASGGRGATRVVATTEIVLRGAAQIFGPLVAFIYGRMWARGLANLKQMMESGAL